MTATLMETKVARPSTNTERHERSVQEIIGEGRSAPAGSLGAWGLSLLTALLCWAAFTPLDWGPLGFVCLVPVLLLVRIERPTRWMYTALTLTSFGGWVATLQWMRLGDPSMYPAWLALSAYLAFYLPTFVGLTRVAVHRLRVPMMFAAPVVWTGLELLRAHLMTGFPWYFIGHTQHHWAELIQIADVFGTYGVSFLLVLTSAAIAGLVPPLWMAKLRLLSTDDKRAPERYWVTLMQQRKQVVVCLLLLTATLTYGFVRRGQAAFTAGPRVALIQGNFTTSLKHDPDQWGQIFKIHRYLTGQTVKHQPDLVVWPETMFRYRLFEHAPGMSDEQLEQVHPQIPLASWKDTQVREVLLSLAEEANASSIIGLDAIEASPDSLSHYNSAAFIVPAVGITSRYDKVHRVPFGEYIPLRETLPWIQRLTPFGDDFGIQAGESIKFFDDGEWRYVPLVCFEDTVPHLVRQFVEVSGRKGEPADVLVNLTNDGWFHGSSELDQHLITARFRSIETRTPMVRAVNTGISAIIDGDGLVVEPEVFFDLDGQADGQPRTSMRNPETGKFHKQLNCAIVGAVPLDPRSSLYVRWGDWFASICAACCVALVVAGFTLKPKPLEM
ncbi:MAG: apolipoprotein N-acyltransferase [Planctomycetaceae bacterium]|nr:apolipoprotein N-acyltransferase [Planctomycetaceae bacterium]